MPVADPFCPHTRSCLIDAAKEMGLAVHPTGTCITIEGPRFSSRAESLLFKSWGAHVINMTTVPEVRKNHRCARMKINSIYSFNSRSSLQKKLVCAMQL